MRVEASLIWAEPSVAISPVHTYPSIGGLRLHLATWENPAAPQPPLLLLHGGGDSWQQWAEVATYLTPGRTVLALDLRGHGESEQPSQGYSLHHYRADVLELLSQLPYTHLDMLGHSLGAVVGLLVAAQQPQTLRRLVVADPPLIAPEEHLQLKPAWASALALKQQPEAAILSIMAARSPQANRAHLQRLAHDLKRTHDGVFEAFVEGGAAVQGGEGDWDWPGVYQAISIPVLALSADAERGGWLHGERLGLLHRHLSNLRVQHFPGAGHHLEADQPQAFLNAVVNFLDQPQT